VLKHKGGHLSIATFFKEKTEESAASTARENGSLYPAFYYCYWFAFDAFCTILTVLCVIYCCCPSVFVTKYFWTTHIMHTNSLTIHCTCLWGRGIEGSKRVVWFYAAYTYTWFLPCFCISSSVTPANCFASTVTDCGVGIWTWQWFAVGQTENVSFLWPVTDVFQLEMQWAGVRSFFVCVCEG